MSHDDNPDCSGAGPHRPGEVRILPHGRGTDGNDILCRYCFHREIRYRNERNREAGASLYETPTWAELEVYRPAMEDTKC